MKSHGINFLILTLLLLLLLKKLDCSLFQALLEHILIISCYLHDSFVENMYAWFQTNKLCPAPNFQT